jgi:hypothetical protein
VCSIKFKEHAAGMSQIVGYGQTGRSRTTKLRAAFVPIRRRLQAAVNYWRFSYNFMLNIRASVPSSRFFDLDACIGSTTGNKCLNLMYEHKSDLLPDRQTFTETLSSLITELMNLDGLAKDKRIKHFYKLYVYEPCIVIDTL